MRILLFGDERGIPLLTKKIPAENIVGIVCASIRTQYVEDIRIIAKSLGVLFLVQPKRQDSSYLEFVQSILSLNPDLIWVFSYSMILQNDVLAIPAKGAINIHGALLPQYRGANPTQWAILNGEFETGATLHVMTSGIDEGPILDQVKIPLFFKDTWRNVFNRNDLAIDLMISRNLNSILDNKWIAHPQNEKVGRYCRRRNRLDGFFSWDQPVYHIYNLIRALVNPLPGAFFIDSNGIEVTIDKYLSISEISMMKYKALGFETHGDKNIALVPILAIDLSFFINPQIIKSAFDTPYYHIFKIVQEINNNEQSIENLDYLLFRLEDVDAKFDYGYCQLLNINWRNKHAELQIKFIAAIGVNYNLILNSINMLVDFAFKELNLHKICLYLQTDNLEAIEIFSKLKFNKECVISKMLFIEGCWVDVCIMSQFNKHV